MDIAELLLLATSNGASDLHLSAGLPPMLRIDGEIHKTDLPVLEHQQINTWLGELMNEEQHKIHQKNFETDFSFSFAELARFRVNTFMQARGAAAVFRTIPVEVPTLEKLGLPSVLTAVSAYTRGLVLITGAAGAGKSTTLAAMIEHINRTRCQHILTIEDPIEFIHHSRHSLINQREVYRDTRDFNAALCAALRQDPDIILLGELRDLATIRLAITAAETGHLVLATLHTDTATKAINRLIDVFPGEEKAMVRSMLAESLQAVITQNLIKKTDGGRLPVVEIMLCNAAIRNLIREDKIAQMYSVIQTGAAQGMQTFDQHLMQLVNKNWVSKETAKAIAVNKALFSGCD
ncbi:MULTISPECIES: type IV pilus twitching motility protein PilT [unclassified Legionella]|uniref:type IV pilus twitching motility protein PilT n=1 Tax=unclassified Legionella TaxID=2622702 RepID=UPI001056CA01|nr:MULTISPECIES: type IV pilus twitching motility protein PilT [unclassified Legionella]MDI9819748.1 type IV pilus twitching motility protein PilT [Legionella sp. PL877]